MDLYENYLRKIQAASVVACTTGYCPTESEQPEEIVKNALDSCDCISQEQRKIIEDMLRLMESETDIDDISDEELEKLANSLSDEDILAEYDDHEIVVLDEETNEELEIEGLDSINEVLSRVERLRAKARFARSKTKREVKAKISLKKHSNTATLNKRARRLAIKALKVKFAKKSLDKLSVSDKERIEKMIASRKNLINRLAMKLVPKVKKLEKERLAK